MNINDVVEEFVFEDSWKPIFDRQRELMEKYHGIESANGLLQTKDIPVDINCRFGQARLKDFAWRITEELAESWEAECNGDRHHAREECADALHFMVELCILSGLDPEVLTPPSKLVRPEDDIMCWACVFELGMLCNCLKNKPWKQTHVLTDKGKYATQLMKAFEVLCVYAGYLGMDGAMLYIYYFKKSEVNKFRQRSQY